jgi:hypothetical protein
VQFTRLAVGDGGQGAALVQQDGRMYLVTDVAGNGTRDCVPDYYPEYNPSYYDDDPYLPRTHGGPGGGAWEFDDDPYSGPGGSGAPPANPVPVGSPAISAARAGQRKRTARVVVVCRTACTIDARARIAFAGQAKALVTGTARTSSNGKPKLVEIPLTMSASTAKTIDAALRDKKPKRALLLTIGVTATIPKQKKQTREVTILLGPSASPFR